MAVSLRRRLVHKHVLKWVEKEREYADTKYPISTIEQFGGTLRAEDIDFVNRYLERAALFGLDTLKGRQALGKALSTVFDFSRSAVYLHGAMPQPAVDSTEGSPEWKDAPPI